MSDGKRKKAFIVLMEFVSAPDTTIANSWASV